MSSLTMNLNLSSLQTPADCKPPTDINYMQQSTSSVLSLINNNNNGNTSANVCTAVIHTQKQLKVTHAQ